MEWFSKLLDIKKIPTRYILLAWIISFLLLFFPNEIMTRINLIEFQKDFGKYFGIVFITATGLLIMLGFNWIFEKVNEQRSKTKYKKLITESISSLDPHEKAVLREYFLQEKNTLKIPIDNPTISGLITKRILYPVSQHGEMSLVGMLFNCSITETARENFTFEILELPVGEPTEKEIEKLRESRPLWMIKLESKQRFLNYF